MGGNPIDGFTVSESDIQFIGEGLQRPECVLAERDGTLWCSDARGGVVRINPDRTQQVVGAEREIDPNADPLTRFSEGTLPNGLAFTENGELLIANFGTDRLEVMTREGKKRVLCDTIDGQPMGKANFVLRDRGGRLWLTVSTRKHDWLKALREEADGYIALIDEKGPRIVAEGLAFTNECRLDANEEYLHVVETAARHISRFRVLPDGSLTSQEVYGPADLLASPDGIAFDYYGNLWGTFCSQEQVFAITPEGDLRTILDLGKPDKIAEMVAAFIQGSVTLEHLLACGSDIAPLMTSVTFGGPDLKTVYIGTLAGSRIPYFRSPVAGLPLAHW